MSLMWFCGKNTNDAITMLDMVGSSSKSFTLMSQLIFFQRFLGLGAEPP